MATIRQDVACPRCDYNLHGLHGDVIHCPECGQACNIPKLIAQRWTLPWWRAPGFSQVIRPAAFSFILIPTILYAAAIAELYSSQWTLLAPMVLAALTFWVRLMWKAHTAVGVLGVKLALFAHLIIVAGFASMITLAGSVAVLAGMLIDPPSISLVHAILAAGALLIAGMGFYLCHRSERMIATQCFKVQMRKLANA